MVKYPNGERGQALVLAAMALVALLILAGLAIDGGMVFLDRRRMQNAADAAALAGAQALTAAMCGDDDADTADAAIYEAVTSYARSNGVKSNDDVLAFYVQFTVEGAVVEFSPPVQVGNSLEGGAGVPTGAAGVAVTTDIEHGTHLISLAGIDTAGAAAPAEAVTGPLLAGGGGLPIIMDVDLVGALGPGQPFNLELCSQGSGCSITDLDGHQLASHRGWLNLGFIYNVADAPDFPRCKSKNSNANDLKSWINGGPGSDVIIYAGSHGGNDGDFIHAIPGEKTAAIQAICPQYIGKLIYIPLFDRLEELDYMEDNFQEPPIGWPSQGQGGWYYHVVGFVGFEVTDCNHQGSVKYIQGEFVEALIGAGITSPNAGFGNDVCSGQAMVVTLWE